MKNKLIFVVSFFVIILICLIVRKVSNIRANRKQSEQILQQSLEESRRKSEDLERDRQHDLKEIRDCILRNRKRQEELGPNVKVNFRWYDGDVSVVVRNDSPSHYHRSDCHWVSNNSNTKTILFSDAFRSCLSPCPFCRPRIRDLNSIPNDYDLVRKQLKQEDENRIISSRPDLIKERIRSFDPGAVPEEIAASGAVYISKSFSNPYFHNDIRCLGHMDSMLVYKNSAISLLYKECPKCSGYAQPYLMVAVSDKSKTLFHYYLHNCISPDTRYLVPIHKAYKRGLSCCPKCYIVLSKQYPLF